MPTDLLSILNEVDYDKMIYTILNYLEAAESAELKHYKHNIQYKIVELDNEPFKAIQNSIMLESTYTNTIAIFLSKVLDTPNNASELEKNVQIYQKMYFPNADDKLAYKQCIQGNLVDFEYLIHTVASSPAPAIVKHREFFCAAEFKVIGDSISRIYMQSVPQDFDASYPGAVTANLLGGYFEFKKMGKNTVLEEFLLADPVGKMPPLVYNTALTDRNDSLIAIDELLEAQQISK